ncbi:hypothetical protein [Aerococcus sp. UMB7834]|nr:hypothetical protein [Aerococcus sp. UMB7834]MDK6805393.1 hypothetical protein [Aerococcus sp. UMB7834]
MTKEDFLKAFAIDEDEVIAEEAKEIENTKNNPLISTNTHKS